MAYGLQFTQAKTPSQGLRLNDFMSLPLPNTVMVVVPDLHRASLFTCNSVTEPILRLKY